MFSRKKKSSLFSGDHSSHQHPDLPLPRPSNVNRSTSVHHNSRASSPPARSASDRRSIGHLLSASGQQQSHDTAEGTRPASNGKQPSSAIWPSPAISPYSPDSLGRSPDLLQQRDGAAAATAAAGSGFASPTYEQPPPQSPHSQTSMSNSHHSSQGKTSSDSGGQTALDRWSQRRLQRLNTEQGFREQRQGGQQTVLSPPLPVEQPQVAYQQQQQQYQPQESQAQSHSHQHQQQQQQQQQQQPQPHPSIYATNRPSAGSHPNAHLLTQTQPASNSTPNRSPLHPQQEQLQPQAQQTQGYPPADPNSAYATDSNRPHLQQSRSFNQQERPEETPMSLSNNGGPAAKGARQTGGSRQSVHNGLPRESSGLSASGQQQSQAAYNASVVPAAAQGQAYRQQGDHGRITPQAPQQGAPDEMSEDDVSQLVKDHKELREKYTKVKKYYFEKEDQVKQLQNSLAHQRLSQSRTSLDDSEYTTRFNRLDGLIAQLAFSIRKSWRSMPSWLVQSVNKDAVSVGKQEMTAAGRAFISCWLVEEVFDRYFHPDLDPTTSVLLKQVQRNIRRYAPPAQSAEEEEYLISKVVNWRLSTLEGLQEALRKPECATNRAQLTDMLKENLVAALAVHQQDPPPSDLEGGVHMIVELVVSIAIHLPMESRDVVVEYFAPGHAVVPEQMKVESGIPPLGVSIADENAERVSLKSVNSDRTDGTDGADGGVTPKGKRGMLSAFTGSHGHGHAAGKVGKGHAAQGKHVGAGGSSGSLGRPESAQGGKEEGGLPRVRMAAGIGVQIRGRMVLVKAPVFSM